MAVLRVTARPIVRWVRRVRNQVRGALAYCTGLPSKGEVSVSYGYLPIPNTTDIAHAGIIKLQRMRPVFPETGRHHNILYMVSSRMPHDAIRFAQWSRAKRAKFVWNQNGVAYPGWHGAGWERTNAPMAELLGRADYIFYQSRFCKE